MTKTFLIFFSIIFVAGCIGALGSMLIGPGWRGLAVSLPVTVIWIIWAANKFLIKE